MSNCPICLETLDKTMNITTPCNHVFHLSCLRKCDSQCPLCRQEIEEIDTMNLEVFENKFRKIKFCPWCSKKPWKCKEPDCNNKVCNCVGNKLSFFSEKNPIENLEEYNEYIIQNEEYRCIYCYKNRDIKTLTKILNFDKNSPTLVKDYNDFILKYHNIYFRDCHNSKLETHNHMARIKENYFSE